MIMWKDFLFYQSDTVELRKKSSQEQEHSKIFYLYRPANIYLFKVNKKNTRKKYEICSKLTRKSLERHRRRSSLFIIDFEDISQFLLAFVFLNR